MRNFIPGNRRILMVIGLRTVKGDGDMLCVVFGGSLVLSRWSSAIVERLIIEQ